MAPPIPRLKGRRTTWTLRAAATPHRLRRSRVVKQLAVRRQRFIGVRDDAQLGAWVEPPLDSLVWIGDDRGTGRGKLERTTRRRRVEGRMRTTGDVQVHAGA